MTTSGPISPEIEQLATNATQTVLAGIRDETTAILQQSAKLIQAAELDKAYEYIRQYY